VDLAKDYFVPFAMRFQAAINEAAARGGGSKVRCVSKVFSPIFRTHGDADTHIFLADVGVFGPIYQL